MGIFSRLGDIINSNIVNMLDKAEDPEKMLRLMIQEMEDTLVEVKSQAARIIADKKTVERHIAEVKKEAEDWQQKAELAISKDRDDLAKGALEEKSKKLKNILSLEKELVLMDEAYFRFKADIERLEAKLEDAKNRKKSLQIRSKATQSQITIHKTLNELNSESAFSKFENFERNIDRLEGELEAFSSKEKAPLASEFEKLEQASAIDTELEALKKKLKK